MRHSRRARYPTKAVIDRVIAAARGNGIDVAGFEVSPEGSVKVLDARAIPNAPLSEFERWEAQL